MSVAERLLELELLAHQIAVEENRLTDKRARRAGLMVELWHDGLVLDEIAIYAGLNKTRVRRVLIDAGVDTARRLKAQS